MLSRWAILTIVLFLVFGTLATFSKSLDNFSLQTSKFGQSPGRSKWKELFLSIHAMLHHVYGWIFMHNIVSEKQNQRLKWSPSLREQKTVQTMDICCACSCGRMCIDYGVHGSVLHRKFHVDDVQRWVNRLDGCFLQNPHQGRAVKETFRWVCFGNFRNRRCRIVQAPGYESFPIRRACNLLD